MKKIALWIFVLGVVFAVKPTEILEMSRYNLDEAVKMLQSYITENPFSKSTIDRLGKVIYSKLYLKDTPVYEAVVEEKFSKLLEKMKDLKKIDDRMLKLIENVFPDMGSRIARRIEKLDRNAITVCSFIPLKVKIDPGETARALVREFERNPSSVDLVLIGKMRCVENYEDFLWELKKELRDLVDLGEEEYAKVYSIVKGLGMDDTEFSGIARYFELLGKIETSDPNSMTPKDYAELFHEYEHLGVEKEVIREKLVKLAKELLSRGLDLSFVCSDPELCPEYERSESEKENSSDILRKYSPFITATIAVVVAMVVIKLSLSKSIKYKIKKLQKRIAKDPLNPDLHIELAQLYEEIGMMEEAMKEYRMASRMLGKGE